jgi:hypothetical protein
MGLPMYVSPSISKRQLPSKQPTSPPYTPQAEESFEEAFQNARTSVFGNFRVSLLHRKLQIQVDFSCFEKKKKIF